jgi:hypothetical protein
VLVVVQVVQSRRRGRILILTTRRRHSSLTELAFVVVSFWCCGRARHLFVVVVQVI